MRPARRHDAPLNDSGAKRVKAKRAARAAAVRAPVKAAPVRAPVKAKPRYSEVADQLRLAIMTGQYPVGTLLPSEADLCQEFGVSRHTVREAIRTLQLRGLVAPEQGRGTRVESDHQISRVARLLGSIEEVERHGRDTHLVNLRSRLVQADADLAASLPCAIGETLLKIESYREPRSRQAQWPRAWNETYIRAAFVAIQDEIESWPGAVYQLVERRFGERVTLIRQEVAAIDLPGDVAKRLSVKTGTAGLRVKRTYIGRDGEPLLYGFNTYVGDQFELVMEIRAH